MELSNLEKEFFLKYSPGCTKQEFFSSVTQELHRKKLVIFNRNFVILTKEGNEIFKKLVNKRNVNEGSYKQERVIKSVKTAKKLQKKLI